MTITHVDVDPRGSMPRAAPRHHYIDWLRNLAILYLFPYHTARMFDAAEPYYVQGAAESVTTALINVSYWFMPLLFLLAGMSSVYALRHRTPGAYARERVVRLLVPLLFGIVVIVPPQAYLAQVFHSGRSESYAEFLGGYFLDWSDLSGYSGTFTPGQLWFIAFLLVSCLALLPIMARWTRAGHRAGWLRRRSVLLAGPTLALLALGALPALSGKNLFLYAGYFFLGFLLATDGRVMDTVAHLRRITLVLAVIGAAAVLLEHATIGWQSGSTTSGILFSAWHQFVTWVSLLAILGYARVHLNRSSRVMTYLNEAGFPLFVLHQTVLVGVGYVAVATVQSSAARFALTVSMSLLATIAAYEAIHRIDPLRVLIGLKRRRRGAAPTDHDAHTERNACAAPTPRSSSCPRPRNESASPAPAPR